MEPNGREADGRKLKVRVLTESEAGERSHEPEADLVFDFEGLHRPDVRDLALILTARLEAGPGDRVWVRALPQSTWTVLRALGLAHLFLIYPGTDKVPN